MSTYETGGCTQARRGALYNYEMGAAISLDSEKEKDKDSAGFWPRATLGHPKIFPPFFIFILAVQAFQKWPPFFNVHLGCPNTPKKLPPFFNFH